MRGGVEAFACGTDVPAFGQTAVDHFGAIGELFIGGALMGRTKPLRIWGPSGKVPELGTAYAIQKMEEM